MSDAQPAQPATQPTAQPALLALDERGLPPHLPFNPRREVTPRQARDRIKAGDGVLLIDCRRPDEWQLTRIDGAMHIPLDELPGRLGELAGAEDREIIVYCRSGARSLKAVDLLDNAGFDNVRGMAGGINLWNMDIEPGRPIY